MTEFIGFPRPDGSIGIRNGILLLGIGSEGGSICYKVAGLVKETLPVFHNSRDLTLLSHMVRHPNVAGIVVVREGLDGKEIETFISNVQRTGKPHSVIDLRGFDAIEAISKTALSAVEVVRDVSNQRRQLTKFSKLLPGLINVPVKLMTGALKGFVELLIKENGRCLWVPKEGESKEKMNKDIRKKLIHDLKTGQPPGHDPGIYKYSVPQKFDIIWKTILASGAQLIVLPVEEAERMAHPLIPVIHFIVYQDTNASDIYDLNLSKVTDGQLTVEEAGLLLLNEVLSTASGKFTKDELLRDVIFAA